MTRYIDADILERWIPVSEKLPKSEGYYLATYLDSELYADLVGIVHFSCNYKHNNGFFLSEKVSAWMPLPDPYKGGDDNA